tara:strand:- start:24 stop:1757 length:1734 start_codon:yes stop_codon:yes gene_type:complete
MSTVYKNFTPQDYAVVPFNAHKQYNFVSSSASSNSINHYNTKWTSESISLYSSASAVHGGDTINTTKYNQLDNLFYRNFKKIDYFSTGDKYLGQDTINYLKHKRALYKEANILSLPTGLYGHEVKPQSLYISSSVYELKDDGYGNLIEYNANISNYETDIRTNILNIGPVNGFKRYDLNTFSGYSDNGRDGYFYRDGIKRINPVSSYSTPEGDEYDDSYFFNLLKYKNVNFSERPLFRGSFPCIDFNGSDSEVKLGHKGDFNFNPGDDFTIAFWANVSQSASETSYLISKSTTKEGLPPNKKVKLHSSASTPYNIPYEIPAESQYPFEVYLTYATLNVPSDGYRVVFRRSDGDITTTVSSSNTIGSMQHISCRVSDSQMEVFVNGIGSGISGSDNTTKQTQNTANIYIGNKGGTSNFLSGSISQINIYNKALTDTQILNHYSSSNGSPYIGNAFYNNGFVTITHPSYITALKPLPIKKDGNINTLQFQGSHQIYEHEYQCSIGEHEYNFTTNISARKIGSDREDRIAGFQTSSAFQPYITTVGLYNGDNELLVVGKLGQPIKASGETDTTIVLRWDT